MGLTAIVQKSQYPSTGLSFPLSSPTAHSEIVCTLLKALDRAAGPVQRFRGYHALLKQPMNTPTVQNFGFFNIKNMKLQTRLQRHWLQLSLTFTSFNLTYVLAILCLHFVSNILPLSKLNNSGYFVYTWTAVVLHCTIEH
jgi:hypothetical protein